MSSCSWSICHCICCAVFTLILAMSPMANPKPLKACVVSRSFKFAYYMWVFGPRFDNKGAGAEEAAKNRSSVVLEGVQFVLEPRAALRTTARGELSPGCGSTGLGPPKCSPYGLHQAMVLGLRFQARFPCRLGFGMFWRCCLPHWSTAQRFAGPQLPTRPRPAPDRGGSVICWEFDRPVW